MQHTTADAARSRVPTKTAEAALDSRWDCAMRHRDGREWRLLIISIASPLPKASHLKSAKPFNKMATSPRTG